MGNDLLKRLCFSSALFPRVVRGGICPPDVWAAGVAPSFDSLALVVFSSAQCCHDVHCLKALEKTKQSFARSIHFGRRHCWPGAQFQRCLDAFLSDRWRSQIESEGSFLHCICRTTSEEVTAIPSPSSLFSPLPKVTSN